MLSTASITVTIVSMASIAFAHMEMVEPAPLRSRHNSHTGGNIDYNMVSPLDASGSNFPCKGALHLLGTEAGGSVADYIPGQGYSMIIGGQTSHGGGSCQVSLSFDKGSTWIAIHSYVGNCPSGTGKTSYPFVIPADAPMGEALFAWSWFNKIGNREMYMNCAVITIKDGSSTGQPSGPTPMQGRPKMFVANVGNGCSTVEGKDLMFPDPGPDVSMSSSNTAPPPEGICAASSNPVAGDGDKSGGKLDNDKPGIFVPSSVTSSRPGTAPTAPGGVFIDTFVTIKPEVSNAQDPDDALSEIAASVPLAGGELTATTSVPSEAALSGASTAGTVYAAGAPCSKSGVWNCIGGREFQRCASGAWSALQSVAAGTKCVPGVKQDIIITRELLPLLA